MHIQVLIINLYILGLFVIPHVWFAWRQRRREEHRILMG